MTNASDSVSSPPVWCVTVPSSDAIEGEGSVEVVGFMERSSPVTEGDTSVRGPAQEATRGWALGAGLSRRNWVSDWICCPVRSLLSRF